MNNKLETLENRISWDEYFMLNAHLISTRSTCTRLKVGAVLVKDKRIVGTGYNGGISGDDHCIDKGCYVENNHCQRCNHSELNALLACASHGVSTVGCEIYVTHFPCINCMKAVLQAGVKTIYYASDYKNHEYCYHLLEVADAKAIKLECSIHFSSNWEEDSHKGQLTWDFKRTE